MHEARPPTVTGPHRERMLGSALHVLGVVARRDRVLRSHLSLPVVDGEFTATLVADDRPRAVDRLSLGFGVCGGSASAASHVPPAVRVGHHVPVATHVTSLVTDKVTPHSDIHI